MKFDRTKTTAFAAALLMLVAYLALFRPAEDTIRQRFSDIDRETTILEARLALARRDVALKRERARLRMQLQAFHLHDDRARGVQRFLVVASAIARRHGVRITEITSTATSQARRAFSPAASASTVRAVPSTAIFDEVPLNLTVRGTYHEVLRTARDLSSANVPLRLSIDSLVLGDHRGSGTPLLTATLRATLLRDTDEQRPLRPQPV